MLRAYRIVKRRFLKTAFSGEGARINGGRWNSIGTPMIYAAQSRALAAMEMLVHLDNLQPLSKFMLVEIHFAESMVRSLPQHSLPADWNRTPAPPALQHIGDTWSRSLKQVVLHVPSAVVPGEFNYLINPLHRDFRRIRIAQAVPFRFDKRLLD